MTLAFQECQTQLLHLLHSIATSNGLKELNYNKGETNFFYNFISILYISRGRWELPEGELPGSRKAVKVKHPILTSVDQIPEVLKSRK